MSRFEGAVATFGGVDFAFIARCDDFAFFIVGVVDFVAGAVGALLVVDEA